MTTFRPGTRRKGAHFTRNVAPGVHRLEHAYVNCYLLEEGGAITVVDAALPKTWPLISRAIRAIGRSTHDVRALVLTHAHFDHVGFAKRAQDEWGVPVYAHPDEAYIAEHPYRYAHESPRLIYPIQHPKAIPALLAMARAGALAVPGIVGLQSMRPGEVLDVPGHPRVVFSPGHTFGHCAFQLDSASALLCGDAIVTYNPYTGGTGPQIVSGAATANSAQALVSLKDLGETGAGIVLPGHGPAYTGGAKEAADLAFRAGPS